MFIKVAEEFTETPGARYRNQGPFSGEEFIDSLLYPKYEEAIQKNEKLVVDLDGGYGYGSSFLEEAFGGLIRKLKKEKKDFKKPLEVIEIISKEEELWVNKIEVYMKDAVNTPLKGGQ